MSEEPPRGTTFVSCGFDQSVVGRHPRTGEALRPPLSGTFLCPPGTDGMVRATFVWLLNKYGWRGEVHESPLYGDGG